MNLTFRQRSFRIYLPLGLGIFVLDQVTKIYMVAHFTCKTCTHGLYSHMMSEDFSCHFQETVGQFCTCMAYQGPQMHEVIPNFFYITLVYNQGVAYGMFSGHMQIFAFFSLAVFVLMMIYFRKLSEDYPEREYAMTLLLGGIIGNFVDRADLLNRPTKGVVDFISFQTPGSWQFPAFNVADSAICVGVAIYCISTFFRPDPKKIKEPDAEASTS